MRSGFREAVAGWALVGGFDSITFFIERAADWAKDNGPLEPDEEATVELMIRCQIARAEDEGICDG